MNGILKPGQQLNYTHTGNTDIYLDSSLLKKILINLISNAIKFSGENSLIDISNNIFENVVELKVKDAGMSISGEDQKHFSKDFSGEQMPPTYKAQASACIL